jgi:hypothetical protein
MHDLWVEKYRPDTLDGYVFKDKMMELQIREWIENPQKKRIPIPNIMFAGSPGTGKCLGPDEKITIRLDVDSLTDEQRKILGIKSIF